MEWDVCMGCGHKFYLHQLTFYDNGDVFCECCRKRYVEVE
jgi:hypothetical protein